MSNEGAVLPSAGVSHSLHQCGASQANGSELDSDWSGEDFREYDNGLSASDDAVDRLSSHLEKC